MTLTSLDLFSGIGGLTLALEGFAKPVMYCDNSAPATQVLETLMSRGLLPKAPVHNDVQTLDKNLPALKGKKIDMIMGGFPCIGFSPVGKREGFENRQSGLYGQILRLVSALDPKLVFMENVPDILHMGMDGICSDFNKKGYDLRWCTLTAKQFGAPHQRKRWFCLAIKKNINSVLVKSITHPYNCPMSWRKKEPPRMALDDKKAHLVRAGLLGNSVVPCCVRYAFLYLLAGFQNVPLNPTKLEVIPIAAEIMTEVQVQPGAARLQRGCTKDGRIFDINVNTTPQLQKDYNIVLDPRAFKSTKPHSASSLGHSPRVRAPIRLRSWATPRHGMTGTSNFLSERTTRDLPTQLRFERNTPDKLRHGHINGPWVEWMMGYPKDWCGVSPPRDEGTSGGVSVRLAPRRERKSKTGN